MNIMFELNLDGVLEVGDIWPDGDAPEVVTASAVKEVMEQSGRRLDVLRDWGLLEGLEVRITAQHPDWAKGEPLFGERVPRFETLEVWA